MTALVGRTLVPGPAAGEALVCPRPFNTLAQLYDAVVRGADVAAAGDPDVPEILGLLLTGRVLVVPALVGSTSAGAVWEHVARTGTAPAALLVAGPVDPVTAAGLALAARWTGHPIPAVDGLGPGLLAGVATGDRVELGDDGRVHAAPARAGRRTPRAGR